MDENFYKKEVIAIIAFMIVRLIGCGAVGATVAERLYRYSDFALIIDEKRKERYEKGQIINSKHYDFPLETPDKATKCDLLIVAVKNFSLSSVLETMKPFVKEDTVLMSLLNGIDAERTLSSYFGEEKVIYSFITNLSSNHEKNKTVCFSNGGKIVFGEKNGELSERVLKIKELFELSSQRYEIPSDIMHEKWWKFTLNICFNTLSAILDADYLAISENKDFIRAVRVVASEVQKVASAEGVTITQEDINRMITTVTDLKDHGKTSMLQDVEAGRDTENDYFAGTISRLAKAHQIPSPAVDFIYILLEARRACLAKR